MAPCNGFTFSIVYFLVDGIISERVDCQAQYSKGLLLGSRGTVQDCTVLYISDVGHFTN